MSKSSMYSNNYLKSFTKGLEDSKFSIVSKDIASEEFLIDITEKISLCRKNNGRLFFIGNGASAAFSNHMALDWSKNGKIPSFSLSDSALMTALGNDYEYKLIFVKFLEIYDFNTDDYEADGQICIRNSSHIYDFNFYGIKRFPCFRRKY